MKELASIFPEIFGEGGTRTRAAKLERTKEAISTVNASESHSIGFGSPYLINCTLPHSKPRQNPFVRSVPWCTLEILGFEKYGGVPYGSPARLFLAYVQTDYIRHRSREIRLAKSLAGAARRLGIGTDSRSIARFRRQLMACFAATWIAEVDKGDSKALYRFAIASAQKFNYDPKSPRQVELWEPIVTISEDFARMLEDRGTVPFDLRALKGLAKSPLGMDLYVWACCRAPQLHAPQFFPYWWFLEQWGAQYPNTKKGRSNFRAAVLRELGNIRKIWPQLRIEPIQEITDSGPTGGLLLQPSPSHVERKLILSG